MGIHHVVFVKFRRDATREAIDRFVTELNRLPSFNPEVRNWKCGFSPEPRFHNGDFDFGLACDLDDWAAMDRYMYNEGHLRLAAFIGDLFEHAISFDFEFGSPAARMPERSRTVEDSPRSDGLAPVPFVVARRLEEAREILRVRGLEVGRVESAPSPFWAGGRVAAQSPADGALAPGSSVDLVVTSDARVRPEVVR